MSKSVEADGSTKKESGSPPTAEQMLQTLKLVLDVKPTRAHLRMLHDGYLTDLVKSIKRGTLPSREEFRKMLGFVKPHQYSEVFQFSVNYDTLPKNHRDLFDANNFKVVEMDLLCTDQFPPTPLKGVVHYEGCIITFWHQLSHAQVREIVQEIDEKCPWTTANLEQGVYAARFFDEACQVFERDPQRERLYYVHCLSAVRQFYKEEDDVMIIRPGEYIGAHAAQCDRTFDPFKPKVNQYLIVRPWVRPKPRFRHRS